MSDKRASSPSSLSSLGIANFKAFGPHLQNIPLRPITLVFGPNSSGKSSLIHFLLWMNEVMVKRRLDVNFPTVSGESVQLGGFKQFRYGNDPTGEIKAQFAFTITDSRHHTRQMETLSVFATCQPPVDYHGKLRAKVKERFELNRARHSFEKLLVGVRPLTEKVIRVALTEVLAAEYGVNRLKFRLDDCFEHDSGYMTSLESLFEKVTPRLHREIKRQQEVDISDILGGNDNAVVREVPPSEAITEQQFLNDLQLLACAVMDELGHKPPTALEDKPSLVRFELRDSGTLVLAASRNNARQLVLESLDFALLRSLFAETDDQTDTAEWKGSFGAQLGRFVFDGTDSWLPNRLRVQNNDPAVFIDSALSCLDSKLDELAQMLEGTPEMPGILNLCELAGQAHLGKLRYLGPLRAYPEREIKVAELPQDWDALGLHAWRRLYREQELRERVNAWLKEVESTKRYEVCADELVSLAKTKEIAAKHLSEEISSIDREVNAAHDLDEKGQFLEHYDNYAYAFSNWDHNATIKKALDIVSNRVSSENTGTIFLHDLTSGKQVSSRDIGVGVSQLLPVLVQAMAGRNDLIAIEQPEIHLHPALQAELGDLFIESALGVNGNQFILETHSEHLILRILRRIRETENHTLAAGLTPIRPEDVSVLFIEPGENGSTVLELPVTADGDFARPWPGGFFAERVGELF